MPGYNVSHEALHGVARAVRATIFPQAIGMVASWDTSLIRAVADAISTEARAKSQIFAAAGKQQLAFTGLSFYSPNINIYRDPHWGRGMETYGEDPYLTSELALAFVQGMQGNHPFLLKTATCAKHYVVHSGPEKDRQLVNPSPTKKDLFETYTPAFRTLVQRGNVQMVMASYNKLYDVPMCAQPYMLKEVLRQKFGFAHLVITDGGALNHMHRSQKYTQDSLETIAAALNNGIDFELGNVFKSLPQAVNAGKVDIKTVDEAVVKMLKVRMRISNIPTGYSDPYASIPDTVINCTTHRSLARKAAASSLVLLKNNGALPLNKNISSIYVVGPNATNGEVLHGNYNGFSGNMSIPLEGLVAKISASTLLEYRPGCRLDQDNITKAD